MNGAYPPTGTPVGPVPNRAYSPARTPAFWLLVAVVTVGALGPLLLLGLGAWVAPRSALAALPLLTVYAALSLAVLRWLDQLGRRPWWLVLLAFGWGATAAVMVGALSGYTLDVLLAQLTSPEFAAAWGPALVAPTAEETAKGAGVLLLLLAARPYLRTPFAGAVYGAVAGVGFATVEDLSYALTAADATLPDHAPDALRVVALRAVVPGLVGHPLFTALVGAGIGYAVLRTDRRRARRWGMLAGAFALAWLVHAAVNSPLALRGTEVLGQLPVVSPMAGYFLVVGVPGALGWYALAVLRRREAARLTARLAPPEDGATGPVGGGGPDGAPGPEGRPGPVGGDGSFGKDGLVGGYGWGGGTGPGRSGVAGPVFAVATRDEAAALATVWARTRTVRAVRRAHGPVAARTLRRLYAAQLAFLDLPTAGTWRARAELTSARTRLGELTGSVEGPVPPAAPTAPRWLLPGAVALGVAGLLHWLVPALAALVLANRRQRPAPLAVAVAVTGYVWLTGALLAFL
ncbi:PrsW family intramembrane metalloprotease [Micromonospora cathayae]|uniref:PrsW family intramembrane metalloprotease n=1 Tax=Micromonospora cathayae TaxID=3028804 RepID=A0ABY7ZW67_9ACTN|nr:PrsW family intramembrane metalloprotease [Micromonospora sp. HUAS 3]WDZ87305.1 PrsW family intramembrane metalloprotease [Micromonospora sp. HUAS 3]